MLTDRKPAAQPRDVRTATPGIFRRGDKYVVRVRVRDGRQLARVAPSEKAAKALQAELRVQDQTGRLPLAAAASITLETWALEWLESYTGSTGRGVRPETLGGYRDFLTWYSLPTIGNIKLADLHPADLRRLVGDLHRRGLSRNTIRLAMAPVRLCLRQAVRDGLLQRDPSDGLVIPGPDRAETGRALVLSRAEINRLLEAVPDEHRLLVRLLAETGLRIGEAVALEWGDIRSGRVHVERRLYRGRIDAPKSRYGMRAVPITDDLAHALWNARKGSPNSSDHGLAFPNQRGGYVDQSNLLRRMLKPAARAASLPVISWHTLRHSVASDLYLVHGLNAVQLQRFMGHHSAAFSVATYVHLADDGLPTIEWDTTPPLPVGNAKALTTSSGAGGGALSASDSPGEAIA